LNFFPSAVPADSALFLAPVMPMVSLFLHHVRPPAFSSRPLTLAAASP
jgi:hypothetical protein